MTERRTALVGAGTVLVLLSLVPFGFAMAAPLGPGIESPIPHRSAGQLSMTLVSFVTLSIGGIFLYGLFRSDPQ